MITIVAVDLYWMYNSGKKILIDTIVDPFRTLTFAITGARADPQGSEQIRCRGASKPAAGEGAHCPLCLKYDTTLVLKITDSY